MKQLFRFWIVAALLLVVGCSKEYDDSALVGRVDDLENRVQKLEQLCQQMNTNISSLQTIVTALQNNDYVTGVTPITENGKTIGYTITFAKAQSITIYHGKDGQNGADGKDGQDGTDGKDSNYVPTIGVKQDTDGIYYWTLDGEWLLDDAGNKIKAQGIDGKDGVDGEDGADGENGKDGEDGTNGKDGADGITPQLKIEDDYWYVSYDNGVSWTQLGKATGEDGKDGTNGTDGTNGADGKSFFQDVTQDENNVYFTLADGTIITVPKGLALSIEFAESDLVVMSPNSTREIGYTVTSATDAVKVEVTSSADIKAKVVADNASGLTGKIHITTGDAIDEYSKVIVFVSNGDKVIMRSITFEEAGLVVEENATKQATSEGGEMTLEFLSNVECEVIIPEAAQSWISVVPATRAMEKQTITLKLEPNTSYYRSATVTVQSTDGILRLEYQVVQDGELGVEIDPTQIPDNEIWYTTTDGKSISLKADVESWPNAKFNTNVVFNGYRGGKGVIEFDGPVTKIGKLSFAQKVNLESIYLPNSVNYIGLQAFYNCINLNKVTIKSNDLQIEKEFTCANPFEMCSNLQNFDGPLASEDGRCLIVKNSLYSFAPYGITEYTIPQGVTTIEDSSFELSNLKVITIPEGVERIEAHAFAATSFTDYHIESSLEYVYLPSTLKYIHGYAFLYNKNIKAFYGENEFVSPDGKCLIVDNYNQSGNKSIILFASGAGLTEYTIPDGVEAIESYAFYYATSLKKLNFPDSFKEIYSGHAFEGATNIETITGKYVLDDNRSMVIDDMLVMYAGAGQEKYTTPKGVKSIGYQALGFNNDIKEYVISDDVTQAGDYGYLFNQCPNLETVTLSAKMQYLGYDPFGAEWWNTPKIKTVYCRAIMPPIVYYNASDGRFDFDDLTIFVPEQSVDAYKSSNYWTPYRDYIKGYSYNDLPELDFYISTDYTQDGKVTTLQTATKGDGIDIVLMGDAYSDRQIADGTYKADMEYIYNNLFTEEPYKSFKDHFNVYYVNVVSATEGYEHSGAALGGYFGNGTLVGGNDNAVFNYALKAISEEEMDEALLIVAMNSDNYAGTCWMYYPDNNAGYGNGVSVSYFPKGGDATTFAQLLHHEACGHGFAKLADEYAYEYMGAAPSDYVLQIQLQQNSWGWWKNVDFTSDSTATRWNHFINDTRYANEGLGAYEGGLTYWTGVWRPTENSIMRYNTGGFNAPSREAIYYRIHKLAYGDSWEYNYEDFVEWDARNRTTSSATHAMVYKPANYKPTHPPVIVNKSWKDAK